MLKVVHSPSKGQIGGWGKGAVIQAKGKHEEKLGAK